MRIFNLFKKVLSTSQEKEFFQIIDDAFGEIKSKNINYWSLKLSDLSATNSVIKLSDKQKVDFILFLIKQIHDYNDGRTGYDTAQPEYIKSHIQQEYLSHLFKIKGLLDEEDIGSIIHGFTSLKRGQWADITSWPLGLFVIQVERNFKAVEIPQSVADNLASLKASVVNLKRNDKDTIKLIEKIDSFLFKSEKGNNAIKPTTFLGNDAFAEFANQTIAQQDVNDLPTWYKLITHAQKASGSKPSAKYTDQSKLLVKEMGIDKFKKLIIEWFEFIIKLKETEQHHVYTYGNGNVQNYTSNEFLAAPNIETLKGFVWMCSQFYDSKTLQTVASLCERSFRKIPGKGPAAAAIGNACLYTLYKSKGLEGIAHLSRLKLRIKQSNTQSLIEKYLQEAAKAEGVSVSEIEDLAVDDYGLTEGKREYDLEGYKAVIKIQGIGDVQINWFKPDNTPQKSVPAFVKEKHSARLKKIKDTAKQIEVSLSAQRDRLDRMLRYERKMSWEYFNKHYFSHGLTSYITKDILWKFESNGKMHSGIYLNDRWTNLNSDIIVPDDSYQVSLWHPATASLSEVRSWREFLMKEKIQQPIKQAFREVYLLTDAEINTRTYSNRMAAHILKQHQFNSLAKTRGWKYSLLGAYDDGRSNEGAELYFHENNLRAEFWVNEVSADDAFNDTGIWNYVSTDQVRFVNIEKNEPIELVDIAPIIFSEVMRDVDLFVGVSSVGNDPVWQDSGGLPTHRDYWQSFSFGDLSEIAKTRKEILENLVPRLKIAPVASIKDRFLVVKGKKRTYKIHIGSTNILMEPNDQYLCIVPDRSKKETTNNVFLPFEGDNGLSVILSKALMLAEDDKIIDSTIISQIERK